MLEFIVLGIVPGTRFNITFSWVLAAAAVFLIILEIRYHKNYALKVQALTANSTEAIITPHKKTAKRPVRKSKSTTTTSQRSKAAKRSTTTKKSKTTARKSTAKNKAKKSATR